MSKARASTGPAAPARAAFDWADPLDLEGQLSEEERRCATPPAPMRRRSCCRA